MILKEISQHTAVLYSDWSLQMGQMGPKMQHLTAIIPSKIWNN